MTSTSRRADRIGSTREECFDFLWNKLANVNATVLWKCSQCKALLVNGSTTRIGTYFLSCSDYDPRHSSFLRLRYVRAFRIAFRRSRTLHSRDFAYSSLILARSLDGSRNYQTRRVWWPSLTTLYTFHLSLNGNGNKILKNTEIETLYRRKFTRTREGGFFRWLRIIIPQLWKNFYFEENVCWDI